MPSPTKPTRPGAWLDKNAMAAVFDVSPTFFARKIRPFVPAAAVQHVDGKILFHARTVIDCWARRQVKPAPPSDLDVLADPLNFRLDDLLSEKYMVR